MVDKMKPGKNHRKNYVYRKKLLGQEHEHCLGVLTSFLVETKEKTLVHNANSLIAIENEEHVNSYRVHEDSLRKRFERSYKNEIVKCCQQSNKTVHSKIELLTISSKYRRAALLRLGYIFQHVLNFKLDLCCYVTAAKIYIYIYLAFCHDFNRQGSHLSDAGEC